MTTHTKVVVGAAKLETVGSILDISCNRDEKTLMVGQKSRVTKGRSQG